MKFFLRVWFFTLVFFTLVQHAITGARADTTPESHGEVPQTDTWHFQATTVTQMHPRFPAEYGGPRSMSEGYESRTSLTSTVFFGHRLWQGSGLYIDPELTALSGLSGTNGMAAFPNGEIYRVDDPAPQLNVSRLFISQIIGLGGPKEKLEDDLNQLSDEVDQTRLTLIAGKFGMNDYFDNNSYSHDPRTQFLNWALMDNGAWDYASDTRGYSWGLYLELHLEKWSIRAASVLVPKAANQLALDPRFLVVRGDNLEIEYRYSLGENHPGKARLLLYRNVAHMGSYAESLSNNPTAPDITDSETAENRTKFGFGLNLEQELTPDLGAFARLGWNNGSTESWCFTEIDRSISGGVLLKGTSWSRPKDALGLALIWDRISEDHAHYLAAGGQGFILGDGGLNTYGPEVVLESFYSYQMLKDFAVSGDYQFVENPGYNHDRGPVHIASLRVHYEL